MKNTQEQQREVSRRINPDSLGTLWLAVVIVMILAVVSFTVSFAGLSEVAGWVGLPPFMSWTIPTFIDTAIIGYGLAVLIHRHRGEPSGWSMVSLLAFTLVSIIANAAHALSKEHDATWQAWIGAGIAGLAPLAVFASTEELARLVIARPDTARGRHSIPAIAAETTVTPPEDDGPGSGSREEPESTTPETEETTVMMDEPTLPSMEEPELAPQPTADPEAPVQPEREPEPVAEAEEISGQVDVFDALADQAPVPQTADEPVTPEPAVAEAPRLVDPAVSSMPRFDLRPRINPVQRTVAEARAEAAKQNTGQVAPEPVASKPEAVAAPSVAVGGGQVTEMDQVARYVASQVKAGNAPRAAELAEILGCVERTARRKIAKLRDDRPELFEPTANTQVKEA